MRRVRAVVMALALSVSAVAVPVAVTAGPAVAGEGYWSPTRCWGGAPLYAKWYGVSGLGVWMNTAKFGSYVVDGHMYALFNGMGAECSWLGLPTTYAHNWGPVDRIQYFYNPSAPCDANYIFQRGGINSPDVSAWKVPNHLKGTYLCP